MKTFYEINNYKSENLWSVKPEGAILLRVICLFQELLQTLFTAEIICFTFYMSFYGHLLCDVYSTYGVFDHFPIDGTGVSFSTLAPFSGIMGLKYLRKQKVRDEK